MKPAEEQTNLNSKTNMYVYGSRLKKKKCRNKKVALAIIARKHFQIITTHFQQKQQFEFNIKIEREREREKETNMF